MQRWYRMPVALFILGVASIAMLAWTGRLSERQRVNGSLVDALNQMRMQTATFHLWLEEALYGDLHEDIGRTWGRIDKALNLAGAILNGGGTREGVVLEPLKNTAMRVDVEGLESLLVQMKDNALERSSQPESSLIGSPLDLEFDQLYETFEKKAEALEAHVENDQFNSWSQSKHLFRIITVAWAIVVIAASIGLWTRERRRKIAEEELQVSNEQLQSRTEELGRHQLHLQELVKERTAELTESNRELHQEVAERRTAVQALQESNVKFEKLSVVFQTLLDSIPDSIVLLSPELYVLWANRGAATMFGKPLTGLSGQPPREIWHSDSTANGGQPAAKAFLTGKTEYAVMPAPDGSIRDTRAFPIRDGLGQVNSVIEIATDVTERLALQAEAQRVAHLASLGELAAGVAHEINNPINGIINYAQILIDDCGQTGGEREIADRIKKEGNRIATIVRSLLSFAHQSKVEKTPVHIHEILSDTLALSGKQLENDGIVIHLNIPDKLPMIMGNHQQIEQVFLNIVSNARYALNKKYPVSDAMKILRISAEETVITGSSIIGICFQDSGTGIPSNIINKATDPFFSTKPKGIGTGLGLSISHGIVSDHGGRLILESVEGEFTQVKVLLPAKENNGS